MPFFCKTVKMNKIQHNTVYSVQLVTSYYGVGPNTSALSAGYDSRLYRLSIAFSLDANAN